MANTPGAKKAVRKIERRTAVNRARRSRVRTYLRRFDEAVTSGDQAVAAAAFTEAQSELMRAVSKGAGAFASAAFSLCADEIRRDDSRPFDPVRVNPEAV